MVVRYSRWTDRLRAWFPGANQRRLALAQAVLEQAEPEIEEKVRDLLLYGATYVDTDGVRIPPDEIQIHRG
jgi:hypothetical protein